MLLNYADSVKIGQTPIKNIYYNNSIIWTADPALDLVFDGRALDQRVSFSRPSTATLFNSSGVLLSAAIDQPRYDHDPVTFVPRGLLVEEQRTNRISNSEYFGKTNLIGKATQTGAGIFSDYKYSTDENGFRVLEYVLYGAASSGGLTTEMLEQFPVQNGRVITLSARMSGNAYNQSGVFNNYYEFWGHDNLSGVGYPWLPLSRFARPVGFFSRTSTPNVSYNGIWYHRADFATNNQFQIGLNISARQAEDGPYRTSYIPTTGTARTRAADTAALNPQGWLSAEKGVFVLQHDVPAGRPLLGNGSAALLNSVGPGRTAFRYDGSGAIVVHNGGVPQSVAFPTFAASLQLLGAGAARANAAVSRLTYYPRRLTVQELQGMTA